MKKYKIFISAAAIFLLIISTLGGCTYDPARRYIQTDPNDMASPNTPTIPNNVVGKADNNAYNDKISATYEMVDFSYITANGGNLNVRTGAGTKFPSIGTIKPGQKIRALGKLDGWYVVTMPDSGRIGCIPAANARPYSTTTGTNTTGTGTATPSTARNTTGAGTTGTGTAGGGTTAAGSGTMSSDESRILQLVNAERAKTGAKSLSSNNDCTKLARMKSQDMVNNNYFSHQSMQEKTLP